MLYKLKSWKESHRALAILSGIVVDHFLLLFTCSVMINFFVIEKTFKFSQSNLKEALFLILYTFDCYNQPVVKYQQKLEVCYSNL